VSRHVEEAHNVAQHAHRLVEWAETIVRGVAIERRKCKLLDLA
jgi:hypothetical protein